MNSFRIRLVQEEDWGEWLRLRRALWPTYAADELQGDSKEMFGRLESEPVFVALSPEGGLCGMIEVSMRTEAPGCSTDRIGYIEGWFVDPAYRRLGVGRALVEAAEAWAKAQGWSEMASDTTSEYPLSPAAHESLSYQLAKHVIHYAKSLV